MARTEAQKAARRAKRKAAKNKMPKSNPKPKRKGRRRAKGKKNNLQNYPAGVGYLDKSSDKPMVMSGSDRMTTIAVHPALTTTNIKLFTAVVDTSIVPGTRLERMKTMFTEYRFKSVRLRYEPSAPTTIGAQIVVMFDYDPDFNPTLGTTVDQILNQATAHSSRTISSVFAPVTLNCPLKNDWLYCERKTAVGDTDAIKFSSEGSLHVLQMTPISSVTAITADVTVGTLYLDWVVQFKGARAPSLLSEPSPLVSPFDWENFRPLTLPPTGPVSVVDWDWDPVAAGPDHLYLPKLWDSTRVPRTCKYKVTATNMRQLRTIVNGGVIKLVRTVNPSWFTDVPLTGTPIPALVLTPPVFYIPFMSDTLLNDPLLPDTGNPSYGGNFCRTAFGCVITFTSTGIRFGEVDPPNTTTENIALTAGTPFYQAPITVKAVREIFDLEFNPRTQVLGIEERLRRLEMTLPTPLQSRSESPEGSFFEELERELPITPTCCGKRVH